MDTVADIRPDQLAESAFRAFHAALGDNLTWDDASPEEEAVFQRLGMTALSILEPQAGKAWPVVADDVWRRTRRWLGQPESELASLDLCQQLAWEALVKHVAMVLDAGDEIDNLGALEASWRGWAEQRMKGKQ